MEIQLNRLLAIGCIVVSSLASGSVLKADDFKGFYLGGNAGGTVGSTGAATTTVFDSNGYFAPTSPAAIAIVGNQHLGPDGFTGGGQAGYNFQFGNMVIGGEIDFDSLRLTASASGTMAYPCCQLSTFTVNQTVQSSWMLTARPRIGYVHNHFLVYGTGGLAMTNLSYQEVFTDTFAAVHESGGIAKNVTGWTMGGGAEYQLARHWSLKGEYLYADFGKASTTSTNLTAPTPTGPALRALRPTSTAYPSNVFTHSATPAAHIVRLGVNFRF
jgi:outer membrane immunogenic protein